MKSHRLLNDEPKNIRATSQHALVQLGERMGRRDQAAASWYPELIRLSFASSRGSAKHRRMGMGQDAQPLVSRLSSKEG